jgi:hypothetical protein
MSLPSHPLPISSNRLFIMVTLYFITWDKVFRTEKRNVSSNETKCFTPRNKMFRYLKLSVYLYEQAIICIDSANNYILSMDLLYPYKLQV